MAIISVYQVLKPVSALFKQFQVVRFRSEGCIPTPAPGHPGADHPCEPSPKSSHQPSASEVGLACFDSKRHENMNISWCIYRSIYPSMYMIYFCFSKYIYILNIEFYIYIYIPAGAGVLSQRMDQFHSCPPISGIGSVIFALGPGRSETSLGLARMISVGLGVEHPRWPCSSGVAKSEIRFGACCACCIFTL